MVKKKESENSVIRGHLPLKNVWDGDGECAMYLLVLNVDEFFFLPPTSWFSAFIE